VYFKGAPSVIFKHEQLRKSFGAAGVEAFPMIISFAAPPFDPPLRAKALQLRKA
jgi:hypothetical protein